MINWQRRSLALSLSCSLLIAGAQAGRLSAAAQPDVLDTVQAMRRRAQAAGNLKSTPQETVTTEGQTIVIDPADSQTVYVPQYDPWLAYGESLVAYPGWAPVPELYLDEPGVLFG